MMKIVMVLALVLAVAFAAPQLLLNNQVGQQLGLPYSSGWTDGPNNGLGPVVSVVPHVGYSALGYSSLGYIG